MQSELTEGSVHSHEVPLLGQENSHGPGGYVQMEAALPIGSTDAPQPQQVIMIPQQQPFVQSVASYQPQPVASNMEQENYLYSNRIPDLTICHWLACLFCNCCGCALVGFILNEAVTAAKQAGYYKLAHSMAQKAKCWMTVACVFTFIPWLVLIILYAVGALNVDYLDQQFQDVLSNNGAN
eukprot:CAMPEP_0197036278 /NCGR_PEP_ID=MMETSP1384-20130603/13842_1 /TAXON_ID=29189 /ORGANISM="Ammonia sp." /LENGTH=180 /DNA_ID=CAMNT_0042466445 /DNA_START=82 /DNA_END=624 /DNA_ORIENTATION=-